MYEKLVAELREYWNDGTEDLRNQAADAIEGLLKEREEQGKREEFIYKALSEAFDEPCNWTLGGTDIDEYMLEHNSDWCCKNCSEGAGAKCWRQFFETLRRSNK